MTGGPARFTRDSRSPVLLGENAHERSTYTYTGITHYAPPSQVVQLRRPFITRRPHDSMTKTPPQHPTCNACQLSHTPGLASSAFARHYSRNHNCFLFLWVLRCFTSPRSLQPPYTFRWRSPDTTPVTFEVTPFGNPRIKARLPTPHGLSQVTTSFIGS